MRGHGRGRGLSGANLATWHLFQFFPQNGQNLTSTAPYTYFKALNGSYTPLYPCTPPPNTTLTSTATPPLYLTSYAYQSSATSGSWVNFKTFQLLCPGMDGRYGTPASGPSPVYPAGSNYDQNFGLDDMTNFTTGVTVGDDTQ